MNENEASLRALALRAKSEFSLFKNLDFLLNEISMMREKARRDWRQTDRQADRQTGLKLHILSLIFAEFTH